MAQRKHWVGGNWKCNGTKASVTALVSMLNGAAGDVPETTEVVVAPTALHIPMVLDSLDKAYGVAAQNIGTSAVQGAFTGDLVAEQIADFGLGWVLAGHSERRTLSGETDADVASKTTNALAAGLKVALCIGESLAEREAGTTMEVLLRQLDAVKAVLSDGAVWVDSIVIAYEPVWAIGTGVTASPEQAQQVHADLRAQWLEPNFGADVASGVRIVYGGSVKGANCEALIANADIDGFLVGGAALKDDFLNIIKSA